MPALEVSSPTRVDLAGGTLDCWPLYLFFGARATTVNLPISLFTHARLTPASGVSVSVTSRDLDLTLEAKTLDEFLALTDPRVQLYQIVFRHFKPTRGFHLETSSESPVGGGLGGSSSLLMSCLRVFSQWLGLASTPAEMIRLASNMEAEMLGKPTGTQDYYPAYYAAGINLIDYSVAATTVTQIELPAELFEKRFILVYTGRSHHSGINNWDVIKKAIDGDRATLRALATIREVASELREKCIRRDFTAWPALFNRETAARLELSETFSSPEIARLSQLALREGAEAVKICGAGGGGCVFLWTPEAAYLKVKSACQHEGFQVLDAKPLVSLPASLKALPKI